MLQVQSLMREHGADRDGSVPSVELLLNIALHGGLVIGAYRSGTLVGFVFGFLAADQETPERVAMARLKHHSHRLLVHPDFRGRNLALRLKKAQRRAVLQQGIRLMTWTFDPLDTFQAELALRDLGAIARTYLQDVYGPTSADQQAPLDQLQAEWWVTTRRVKSRITGERPMLDLANYLGAGAVKVNPSILGTDDLLRPSEQILPIEGNIVLMEIPAQYANLLARDPALGRLWREHTRSLFESVFQRGYLATDFILLREETFPRAYYVFSHGEGTLGA
jgi:predicted GNAT superfamily acetyltransferase